MLPSLMIKRLVLKHARSNGINPWFVIRRTFGIKQGIPWKRKQHYGLLATKNVRKHIKMRF